ncbi:MAG: VOC family protein [Chloroflexota bacterium]
MSGTIDRIIVSVSSLEESLAFYRDWAGMKVRGEEDLSPEELVGLYGLSSKTSAHSVYLFNSLQETLIELVQFKPMTGKPVRKKGKDWDYGIYDICFLVEGVDAIYKSLTDKGFGAVHAPVEYNPLGDPVKEAVIIGPDNTHLAHLQRVTSPLKDSLGRYISIADSAQIVPDMGEALNFYRGIVGMSLINRITLPPGTLDDILGVPKKTRAELAFVGRPASREPMVVLINLSVPGKHLAEAAWPPNLGVCAISFEVPNLSNLVAAVKGAGYKVISGPADIRKAIYGRMRAVMVSGPAGVMVEFLERWPTSPSR